MSSKTRKTITTTTISSSGMSAEAEGAGTSSGSSSFLRRGRAPSPARLSRIQEKEELQSLNDRLANYIDRVRQLETENSRLMVQVRSSEETVSREVTNIKSLYESELNDARKLLDEMAKEKARLQIESGKYKAEADEWLTKYNRKERELAAAQKKLLDLEAMVSDLQVKLTDMESQKKKLESQNISLRSDLNALEVQLATARKQLEEETLMRVDLENRLQSLREDMAFKSQVFEQELNESRSRQVITEEVDSGIAPAYEERLADALREMREEHESHIQMVREEVELFYETKLSGLQAQIDRGQNVSVSMRDELKTAKRRVEELLSELSGLRAQNAQFLSRISELEGQLERESREFQMKISIKDEEIKDLRNKLADMTAESAELWSIKVKLDLELAAYRKLLEGEEERLNLSATECSSPRSRTQTQLRGKKRKVTTESSSEEVSSKNEGYASKSQCKSALSIDSVDSDGKFIKLINSGEKDISIGGWQLKHDTGVDETVFKFHSKAVVKPGVTITVWSADSGQTHNPPSDLVMKSQRWFVSDSMRTTLLNNTGEEMASCEMSKSMLHTSSSFRSAAPRDDSIDSSVYQYSRRHLTPQKKGWIFW
ncbi:lamin-B1 isoform X1 [Octopus bimaculoides]|uniref:lamin-B1 isoform X1 n=1 Tax=Octopus bimaculoides TaxID=37653 RepID=UPI0022DF6A2C|nr:lamin-B1 isoform X1 [Octopus bimaculoides]